jgi:peptide deformylase
VTKFNDELRQLVSDMTQTMYAAEGAGLAAIQVGVPLCLFLVDGIVAGREPAEGPLVLINPEIVNVSEEARISDEGCLSFPGIFVPVKRGLTTHARALDLNRKPFEVRGEGLFSRALQHEYDHLAGRLLIDQVGPVKKQIIKRKMKKAAVSEAA